MNDHLPMIAALFPNEHAAAHGVHEIAHRIAQSFPHAVIDWPRGDAMVQEGLDRLIRARAPDVITQSHRWMLGNVVYIRWSFPEWPELAALAYVLDKRFETAFQVEISGPFDIRFLIHAAREIASPLDYEFVLRTPFDTRMEVVSKPTPISDLRAEARRAFRDVEPSTIVVTPLPDWPAALQPAVRNWLADRATQHPTSSRIDVHPDSPGAFAAAVVAQLNAIAPVRKAWIVSLRDDTWKIQMLLDQDGWTTAIRLNGALIETGSAAPV